MNIKNRIKTLESDIMPAPPCHCGKTLADFWGDEIDPDTLTYCAKCKPKFDAWMNLVAEADKNENWTDAK